MANRIKDFILGIDSELMFFWQSPLKLGLPYILFAKRKIAYPAFHMMQLWPTPHAVELEWRRTWEIRCYQSYTVLRF